MTAPDRPLPRVELQSATSEQMPLLANLLELYARDFIPFHPVSFDEYGRFHYPHLDAYWRDPGRHPLLIRIDQTLAGFVLVQRGSQVSEDQSVWDMAEFFILHAWRRMGAGTAAAHAVWNQFPGRWEIRVMPANRHAFSFWQAAIAAFTGEPASSREMQKDGTAWCVFSFEAASRH